MRIAYVNKSDKGTLTASSSAGSLVAANLKTVYKSQVWRSTGTSATLTVVWGEGVQVGVVALPFSSLSASATVRITGFTAAADVTPSYDSGTVVAIPPIPFTEWPWGEVPLGVNSYAIGNTAMMVKWLPIGSFEKIVIEINDALNPLGYIEAGRLFVSSYYEFQNNADFGSAVSTVDNSKTYRNDASDLLTERGVVFKTLSIPLSSMHQQDRVFLSNILKMSSASYPVLVSIFPDDDDPNLEQEYQIYGKLTKSSAISITNIDRYATSVDIEEV